MIKRFALAAGALALAVGSLATGSGVARTEPSVPTSQGTGVAESDASTPAVHSLLWNGAALAQMADAATRYKRISDRGGWPLVADGASLHEGDVDPRVTALRRRLVLVGDLPGAADTPDLRVYDGPLADAVRRFQARHGLVVDGIVGRETRAALNVTAALRAAQLALNRDRLDRLALELPATGIVVNLPAATLQLDVAGRTILLSRAIVGKRSWPTPLVASTVYEIETNPYWNVPSRIARLELLPQIRKDPVYLAQHNMRVLTAEGQEVPGSAVDWSRFLALGYRLRQDPGPDNPMGALKFSFDNPYAIYIHDTPGKASFAKSTRALSHGCVRIEQPHALAAHLLAGNSTDAVDGLDATIASGETKHIVLQQPMPVRTVYVTAWVGRDGAVQFRPDIYGYDAEELRAHELKVAACNAPAALPAG